MSSRPAVLVTLEDVRAAAAALRLSGIVVRTPLLPLDLDDGARDRVGGAGARVWLKPESLQRTGAFKIRGAYTFIAALSAEDRARGVVAPSSGNHAQAVAFAARAFGVPATVVMPTTVTAAKRAGAERHGARVVLAGSTTHDRMERALEIVADTGAVLVPPYDDPRIVAGQGTVGLEIAEDLPAVVLVVVPVGGGGLSAGVATAVRLLCPEARVVGVEPAGAPKLSQARAAGRPVRLEQTGGITDGLLAVEIGAVPFAHHQAYLDDVVAVSDDAVREAMRLLLDRAKLMVEPSGAITLAALLSGAVRAPAGDTVVVLSGGNVAWDSLGPLLAPSGPAR